MIKDVKMKSIFQLLDRKKFEELAKKWGVDKGVRSFSSWELTQAMLTSFVLQLGSYREVEKVLGIPDSTFGDAMRERSHGFFQELCNMVLLEIRSSTRCRKVRRMVRDILAIDASEISVHGSLFNLAGWKKNIPFANKPVANCMWFGMPMVSGSRIFESLLAAEATLLSA